jgi:DNA-binding transcriptional regulator YiaG
VDDDGKEHPYRKESAMSNMAKLLKETIERTARKQARAETDVLRKVSGKHRKIIAELSARVKDLERQIAQLHKSVSRPTVSTGLPETYNLKFSAKGFQSLRKRLGLSASECGALVGVSGWTVGSWERGKSRPKEEQISAIAGFRKIVKREAQVRLKELAQK